jgi:hypothetical protein
MRYSSFLLLILSGSVAVGCQKEPAKPPEPKGGVNITFPGGSVQTGPAGGVEVKAPNVEVKVPPPK